MSKTSRLLSLALVVLLIGVLVRYWVLVQGLFVWPRGINIFMTYLAVVGVFIGLLLGSIVGLVRLRAWGFYCVYLLVPVSTVLHGIPLVPFVSDLLPSPGLRIWAVSILNVAFLTTAVISHWSFLRGRKLNAGGLRDRS